MSVSPALALREFQKKQRPNGPASSATSPLESQEDAAAASSAPAHRELEVPRVMDKKRRKLSADPLLFGSRRAMDSALSDWLPSTVQEVLAHCGSSQHIAEVRCKCGKQLDAHPANWPRALHWHRLAAELGDAQAMRALDSCCLHGAAGAAANAAFAAIYLQRAQECGGWRKPW
jgi:hypothetical protein